MSSLDWEPIQEMVLCEDRVTTNQAWYWVRIVLPIFPTSSHDERAKVDPPSGSAEHSSPSLVGLADDPLPAQPIDELPPVSGKRSVLEHTRKALVGKSFEAIAPIVDSLLQKSI